MKKSSVMRYVYGIGLIVAAIGFALPIIDLGLLGSYNGFQIANGLKTLPQICVYVLFALFCIGGILAFVPKTSKYDAIVFLLILIDIVAVVLYFVIGKSGGNSGIFANIGAAIGKGIAKFIFNSLAAGAWIFIIGFVVAIVGFILKPKR